MNKNKRDRRSRTRRSGLALVAALALVLALSPAAARPLEDVSPGEAERIVARAFAQLDNIIEAQGCVTSSLVERMDQTFLDLTQGCPVEGCHCPQHHPELHLLWYSMLLPQPLPVNRAKVCYLKV